MMSHIFSTAPYLRTEAEGASVAAANAAASAAAAAADDDDGNHSEFAAASTCHAERHYMENDQTLVILVTLCRGLLDHDGNLLIDIDAKPWRSVRPAFRIKPKAKDYIREIERRWKTFVRPPDCTKVGPRPTAWRATLLLDWLDNHPIVDVVEVAYLTTKVQEIKAALSQSYGIAASIDADGESVVEIDTDANDDGANALAPSPSPARVTTNRSGANGTIIPATNAIANTGTDNFAGISESIKWLGTSVLASAKLFVTQKEKDRAMTIAENEKDRTAKLELAKLEAEKREKEIADERARERINVLRVQIDSLRKDKRQLTMEVLSDNKRSKTVEDFLTVELRQMTKDIEQKEVELNNLLR